MLKRKGKACDCDVVTDYTIPPSLRLVNQQRSGRDLYISSNMVLVIVTIILILSKLRSSIQFVIESRKRFVSISIENYEQSPRTESSS